MYRALYNFDGQGERTFSFKTGDEFNLIEQVNEHWWQMQSSEGEIGLVPSSYLAINKTIKSEIIESIERAIDLIHKNAAKRGGPMTLEERKSLQKLISHRQNVVDDKSVDANNSHEEKETVSEGKSIESKSQIQNQELPKQATPPSHAQENGNPDGNKTQDQNMYMELPDQPKRQAPTPPHPISGRDKSQSLKARRKAPAPPSLSRSFTEVKRNNMNQPREENDRLLVSPEVAICKKDHVSSLIVPDSLGMELVLRVSTSQKMDEKRSQKVVTNVLEGIKDGIPALSDMVQKMISSLSQIQEVVQEKKSFGPEDELRVILDELSQRKDDSQQRSWALHEDFHIIQKLLTKLLKLLAETDNELSKKVLREDDYHYLNNLVVYYQMEPRSGLRVLLIQTFGCFCQFGYEFITQLLCTVLPTELAKELTTVDNITSFLNIALLLTMLFSTGEAIPLHQYAQFNEDFLEFVFDCVERPHLPDEYDQIPYSLVSVLLAFNQHFKEPSENKILRVISCRTDLSVFTEKLILLINREDDPVAIFDYHKPNPSSVIKMLQDLFSLKETANVFFTNDLKVLIDIILRQLTDRASGDKARTQFLSLFYDLITNSNYREHRHRCNEFGECFTNILVNEENDIEDDKYIVRNICSEFNALFPIFI